jgi:MYXO-CTERM domain-containing protein
VPDLTGTGQAVVLVANQQDNRVTVQQQGAGGSFGTVGQLAGGTTQLAPGDVAWTQLRPAGQLPDPVVVSTGSNAVVVYRTIGVQGSVPVFDPNPRTYFVGTTPVSATAADLNNDGVPDLIVANRGSNDVSVIFGSYVGGEWVGKPGPRLRTGGAGPLSVVARDQTGDGVLDLLVFNGASGTVTLLPGVGQGFFDDRSPQTVLDLGDSLAQAPTFVGTTPQGYAVTAGGRLVAFDVAVPGQSTVIDTIRNVVAARALANGTVVAAFGDGSVRLLTPVGNTLEVSAVLQTAGGQAVRPSSVEVVVGANGQLSVLVSSQGSDRIALYGVGQVTGTGGSSGGRGTGGFSLGPAVAGSGLGGAGSGVTVAGESGVSVASASVSVASAGVSAGFVLFSSSGGFGGSGTTSGFSTSAASGQLSAASVLAPGLASASPSSDGGSAEADSAGLVSLQGSSYSTVALLGLGSPHDSGSGDGDERQPDLAARYPFGSATQAERFVAGNGEKERYLQEGPERLEEAGEAGADPWREDPFHRSFRVRHLPPPSAGATDEIERLPLPREEAPADGPPSAALLAGLVLAARRSRRRKGRTP